MRIAFSFLFLLPLAGFAQISNDEMSRPDGLHVRFTHATVSHDKTVLEKKESGEMTFQRDGKFYISGPLNINTDMKELTNGPFREDWFAVAEKVEVERAGNQVMLKGDYFKYDASHQSGTFIGHVVSVENGIATKIGKRAEVDFSGNTFKIMNAQ